MAHQTISDEEFLARALDLFRTYGFEGVSLQHLSDATGLEKASIYYRYPGGKDEIVMAVARQALAWLQHSVLEPLVGPGSIRKRVSFVCDRLREHYNNGTKSCILDALSLPGGSDELKAALEDTLEAWTNGFTAVAKESGLSASLARSRAEEAIVRLEGSLIVSRVSGDTSAFECALKQLPKLLTVA